MRTELVRAFIFLAASCSVSLPLHAHALLPKQARVPGGVAILDLGLTAAEAPQVFYLGKRVCVVANHQKPNSWLAVVGIPLEAAIGNNEIQIKTKKRTSVKSFAIQPKKYATQHLTILDKRKVEPSAADLIVIEKEYLETTAAYAQWENTVLKSLHLAMPVAGRKSSPFGLRRIMNNIPKNAHSGLDIAAPLGTPVKCPKNGKVIQVGNYFYTGNIVFVQHGQGFITSYCHLDTIKVAPGQEVKKGHILGTVGKTGRATGPHLHWSVSLNGVRVDPQLFIAG